MKNIKIRPWTKCHGGKGRLKDWVISYFPENYELLTYVENYVGGGSIVLNKKKSAKEIINDIDPSVFILLYFIKHDFSSLICKLEKLKYEEKTFLYYKTHRDFLVEGLDKAVAEYVIKRMSRGGLGKNFAWQERLRGGQPGSINEWETSLQNLYKVKERLKDVEIYNTPALNLIQLFDGPDAFFYLDPPYLHETRTAKSAYRFEMSRQDHIDLLDVIIKSKAKILISGYSSSLYNQTLKSWNDDFLDVTNNSGQNSQKQRRTERLWWNY